VTHEGSSAARWSERNATVLHSSLTGIGFSFVGATILLALAMVSAVSGGSGAATLALGIIGVIAVGVVLFDMPISSSFDDDGVTRRAVLRHQRLAWDDVDRLSRSRKGMFRSSKMAPTGGLIASRSRRNYTLVDRMEGHAEFVQLRTSLGESGERLGIDRIAQPAIDQTPTWLHRRAKWAPDNQG
jgi:hypothetical protein